MHGEEVTSVPKKPHVEDKKETKLVRKEEHKKPGAREKI
jgi:hypothetical protein